MEASDRNDSPVDRTVMAKLFGDDVSLQIDLLRQFVPQAQADIAEFKAALAQRNTEQVSFIAHRLKSPARTVGANRLADLFQALEIAGRDADWVEIEHLALEINPTMERVRNYINAL